MNDITLFPADIAAMSVGQLAALPAVQKAEIDKNLDCRHVERADSAVGGCVVERRGANSLTGRPATPCRSTRPRRPVDTGR